MGEDLFFKLGRKAGAQLRKGRWILSSVAGSEEEALAAELEAGRDLAQTFEGQSSIDPDPQSRELLDAILGRLSTRLTNKQRRWQIKTISSDSPGAFALPGGFLYATRPLLEMCHYDEAEVACVVGHEMAHVVKGHAMERITNQLLTNAAMSAARIPAGLLSQWILKMGSNLLFSAYSQDQELDADEFGARLAAAAGYDPRGAIRALSRLQHLERDEGMPLAEYFASHPPLALRIETLGKLIRVKE